MGNEAFERIPCSAAAIPCFSPEQGIHAQGIDMSHDQAAPTARNGANPAGFREFPVKFPVLRERILGFREWDVAADAGIQTEPRSADRVNLLAVICGKFGVLSI